jgi:lysophospholipase L1-like esterase
VAAIALVAVGACSGGSKKAATTAGADQGKPITYVAIGASESVGVGTNDPAREAWPAVLDETALPKRAVFVNLGISGATVADALQKEVPVALTRQPTLVTVWLNVNDLTHLVSVESYEQSLDNLVHQLRRGGNTKVLVANTPPVADFPAYIACRPNPPAGSAPCELGSLAQMFLPGPEVVDNMVAAYNAAIARVVARDNAVLVDLHAAAEKARADGTEQAMFSADGFHPSVQGHRVVAETFAAALRSSGGAG